MPARLPPERALPAGQEEAPHPPAARDPAWIEAALDVSDSAIIVTDGLRRICYVNAGFTRMFGFTAAEVLGRMPSEVLLGPDAEPAQKDTIHHGLRTWGQVQCEALIYGRSGQPRWVSMVINRPPGPQPDPLANTTTVLSDITLTKMHEVLQKKVLEGMVHELPLRELMLLVCTEVERIAPEVTATILSVDDDGRVHPLAAPRMPAFVSAAIDGLSIGPCSGSCGTAAWRGEPVLVTDIQSDPLWADYRALFAPTGLKTCWSSPIKTHQGKVIGTFAFYFHASRIPDAFHQRLVEVCVHLCEIAMERDATRKRVHQLAYYDVLTGLPNRTMFKASSEQTLTRLREDGQSAALLFIDLDRFKRVNDSQGHAAGDALLCEVARRLTSQLGSQDLAGRLAGDEFGVLLRVDDATQAVRSAERILQTLGQPVQVLGQTQLQQASIGIALFPADGADIDTLLRHADQAMYQAKSDNRHGVQLFRSEMNLRTQARAALEQALRQALDARSLTLHYQPQLMAGPAHTLYGVEALARWQHPEWGPIPPDQFIPVAEETGLIGPLTDWLVEEACGQLLRWRQAGLSVPHMAINLSARSFHEPDFANHLEATLRRLGLVPSDIVLEITESVMMDAHQSTLHNIDKLHAQGFCLSLDDFGTGYSSLSYLHRLPISELKLDKSFVQDLAGSPAARALIQSVMSIARSLDMVVVAEGVETISQQEWLENCGCPVLQGYLFSRPLTPQALRDWMELRDGSGAG